MKCPVCGLYNPDEAMRCDCGYDFDTAEMKESFVTEKIQTPSNGAMICGWIFSFLGGLIGIVIGYMIAFSKNKEGYKYDLDSRRKGKSMFVLGIFMMIVWSLFSIYAKLIHAIQVSSF